MEWRQLCFFVLVAATIIQTQAQQSKVEVEDPPFVPDGDPFLSTGEDNGSRLRALQINRDPCDTTVCGRGRECQLSALGEAVCVCRRPCPSERGRRPACGSDGRYYASHCELHRTACLEGTETTVDRRDACLKRKDVERVGFRPRRPAPPPPPPTTTTTTVVPDPSGDESSTQRECSHEEYDFMKENLLLFNNARLMDNRKTGNEYLVSVMFSHYDQNNNGRLEAEELWQAAERDGLGRLSAHCILADMLLFDDPGGDGALDINEFYVAFSVSVVSLDKALEVNHVTARVGDNVEIRCDVRGTPPPPIVWRRNDVDLSLLNDQEVKVSQVFVDGSLYLTNVQLVHAGNYTCHARRNKDVTQTHVLHVQTLPEVRVVPKLQSRAPGELAQMECRATGVPQPRVTWLKNDEELRMGSGKYAVVGNGTRLVVGKVTYSDTGAYMCVAASPAGATRDIGSLVVQDGATSPPGGTTGGAAETRRLFAFHDRGVSVYEPRNCRLFHQVQSTDVIPGTQEYVCGDRGGRNCSWGRAVSVAGRYIYASQPDRDRVLVISRSQMVVVDVVVTDKYPVEVHWVPNLDQVWVVCWRSPKGVAKTVQIIRDASQRKKHHTVHPEPVDGHFDLVSGLFVPPAQELGHGWRYGYVVHTDQRGMYKLDLQGMRYLKTVDLTPYNCAPHAADFASLGGLVILECLEPVTHRPTGQIVLDYLTDTVLAHSPALHGAPRVSPDSRRAVTVRQDEEGSVVIVAQEISEAGLRFLFDVKTTLRVSDAAFFPSRTTHGYDLWATSAGPRRDLLFVDLATGKVEMVAGGPGGEAEEEEGAAQQQAPAWGNPQRPVSGAGVFGRYLAAAAGGALLVVNGETRTVNCEVGAAAGAWPRLMVWA